MRTIDTIERRANAGGAGASLLWRAGTFAQAAIGAVDRMLERRRSRIALLEMSDAQLKDIGVSRTDARREALRRFWQ